MISYDGITFLDSHIPHAALSWRNDEKIFATCRQHTLLSIYDHQKWLQKIEEDNTIKMFGICSDKCIDGKYQKINIGVCGLTSINWIARHAEFSLYIAPEYQGHGYAKSALCNLLTHGFNCFNLHKIWGETFESNSSAVHIFRNKFNMTQTFGHRDHYFKDGKYVSTYIFSILENEFKVVSDNLGRIF